MKPRSQRRRAERRGSSDPATASRLASNGLVIAGLIGVGAAIIAVGILLLTSNSNDGEDRNGGDADATDTALTDGSTPIPVASPATDEEIALESIAQRLIDWLPQGKWPELYDDFTNEFKERCSREAFAETGELSAREQGAQLQLIRYAGVQDFGIEGTTATLIIVGQIGETSQYTIRADFEKSGDVWLISPVPGSTGCEAFSRLSG
jgi:hypothetical protein